MKLILIELWILVNFIIYYIVNGIWKCASDYMDVVDPLNGDKFLMVPNNLVIYIFIN